MNQKIAHFLVRLYPRSWRERYGEEFEELLVNGRDESKNFMNVLLAAFGERLIAAFAKPAGMGSASFGTMVRLPSAMIPMAMSLSALAIVGIHIAMYGAAREADEGATAHLWQLLMAFQVPVLIAFAIKWLPKAPRQALGVIALQAAAFCASLAPVFFLNL